MNNSNIIVLNKKAFHDYFIEYKFEAGLVLEGWEVKSLRSKNVQLRDGHIILRNNGAWMVGCHITPLSSVSTHISPDPIRTRKLLLNKSELNKLYGSLKRRGYTIIPLKLYWKCGRAKCEIALAKGKKSYDKRESIKKRDWNRQKDRIIKNNNIS